VFFVVFPKIFVGKGQRIRHQAVEAFVGCGEEECEVNS